MSESTDKGNYFFFKSPLGPLLVAEKDGYLVRIDFTEQSNTRLSSSLTEGFKEAETPILRKHVGNWKNISKEKEQVLTCLIN